MSKALEILIYWCGFTWCYLFPPSDTVIIQDPGRKKLVELKRILMKHFGQSLGKQPGMVRHPEPGTARGPDLWGTLRGWEQVLRAWWRMTNRRALQDCSHVGTQAPAAGRSMEWAGRIKALTLFYPTFWFPNGVSDWPIWMIPCWEISLPGTEQGREQIWIEVGTRQKPSGC